MADNARTRSLRLVDPPEETPLGPADIALPPAPPTASVEDGVLKVEHNDGSVTLDFAPKNMKDGVQTGFYENLAEQIDEGELARIATELLDGISRDDQSRQEWLETRARGIKLLGLKLDEPRGDVGASSAPLEGMSTVRHPLLLESTLRFHANARGELLPAAGPCKIRNDSTMRPMQKPAASATPPPGMGHNGGPPMMPPPGPQPGMPPQMGPPGMPPMGGPPGMPPGMPPPQMMPPPPPPPAALPEDEDESDDELAEALEIDMNHFLTAVATEYYPDTDRMLFWVGAGGQGIKKVYNCPLRQRPVSESVDAEDIIVSNATTNLENCGRITHRIKMRPSTLKRMQLIGAYRDVDITAASQFPTVDPVKQEKADTQGVNPNPITRPEDADHEIYETLCELDIAGFEHKKDGKVTGLRCPYKVTIHKDTRQILEVRRNWDEKDKLCMSKQYFVDFPFVRAMGFYGIGFIHIVGNTTNALTASWREMLDAGMFASFPGFIYDKSAGRQLTNQFRVPPGGGIPMDAGPNGRLADKVMPLPYREPGAAFAAFLAHVEEVGQRVAGTAEIKVGEGNSEVPVGTTMALIEQATKVMDAVHKRLHAAQAQEFQLLMERFREDPEAFWRHNKRPTVQWKKDQFVKALDQNDLVPVADPNNPTSLHRIAKASAIKALQQSNPAIYDSMAVDKRIMRIVGIDPEGLFNTNPQATPPDPRLVAAQEKAKSQEMMAKIAQLSEIIKAATAHEQIEDRKEDRVSREKIAEMKEQVERLRILQAQIIHDREAQWEEARERLDLQKSLIKEQNTRFTSEQKLRSDHALENKKIESAERREHIKAEAARAKAAAKPKPSGDK